MLSFWLKVTCSRGLLVREGGTWKSFEDNLKSFTSTKWLTREVATAPSSFWIYPFVFSVFIQFLKIVSHYHEIQKPSVFIHAFYRVSLIVHNYGQACCARCSCYRAILPGLSGSKQPVIKQFAPKPNLWILASTGRSLRVKGAMGALGEWLGVLGRRCGYFSSFLFPAFLLPALRILALRRRKNWPILASVRTSKSAPLNSYLW